jgi:hypothetical protein
MRKSSEFEVAVKLGRKKHQMPQNCTNLYWDSKMYIGIFFLRETVDVTHPSHLEGTQLISESS